MKVLWEERAWADYLYWQSQDRKTLKRINEPRRAGRWIPEVGA